MSFSIIGLPNHAHTCEEENDQELEHKYLKEHLIHGLHHIANFSGLFLLIFHYLGFITQVNRDTINEVNIAKSGTS